MMQQGYALWHYFCLSTGGQPESPNPRAASRAAWFSAGSVSPPCRATIAATVRACRFPETQDRRHHHHHTTHRVWPCPTVSRLCACVHCSLLEIIIVHGFLALFSCWP